MEERKRDAGHHRPLHHSAQPHAFKLQPEDPGELLNRIAFQVNKTTILTSIHFLVKDKMKQFFINSYYKIYKVMKRE